ncbi:expressed unknown protein [Seminavis robusta]|uniref:Uncharacterized protein n=1 Tax=Seminavis robusta TaxID=568900 RepID=A0A9N8D8S1_9STRA|nr:expressed unknown protein [Seminavis robusta]|eukprot:Sro40_g024420.1 n/a (122) ;mRNA; r:1323-1688
MSVVGRYLIVLLYIMMFVPHAATQLRAKEEIPEQNVISRGLTTDPEDFPCPESNNCMLGSLRGQRIHRNYFFGMFCQAKCELAILPLLLPKISGGLYGCGECPTPALSGDDEPWVAPSVAP